MARARRYRSAISGRFVRRSTAKRNPKTTIAERVRARLGRGRRRGNKGGAGHSRARWEARVRLALV